MPRRSAFTSFGSAEYRRDRGESIYDPGYRGKRAEPMRCLSCNAEMILIKVVKDETLMARGFEHHTYMCSACADIERRFVFNKHDSEPELGAAPSTAPPIVPASVQTQPAATRSLLRRVISNATSKSWIRWPNSAG